MVNNLYALTDLLIELVKHSSDVVRPYVFVMLLAARLLNEIVGMEIIMKIVRACVRAIIIVII